MYVCISIYIYLSIYPSIYIYIYRGAHPMGCSRTVILNNLITGMNYTSLYLSIYLSISIYIYLSISISISIYR